MAETTKQITPRERCRDLLRNHTELTPAFVAGVLSEDGIELPGRTLRLADADIAAINAAGDQVPAGPYVLAAWHAIESKFPKPPRPKVDKPVVAGVDVTAEAGTVSEPQAEPGTGG